MFFIPSVIGAKVDPVIAEEFFAESENRLKKENAKTRPTPTVAKQLAPKLDTETQYHRAIRFHEEIRQAALRMETVPPAFHLVDPSRFAPQRSWTSAVSIRPTDIWCDVDHEEEAIQLPDAILCMDTSLSSDPSMQLCYLIQQQAAKTEERATIEAMTRGQSNNANWYLYRAGAITGSTLGRILRCQKYGRANPNNIVKDLLKWEKHNKPQAKACQWGHDHEEDGIKSFVADYRKSHTGIQIERPGLMIHPKFGYLRASPDALIRCECCDDVTLLEVKCPLIKTDPISAINNKEVNWVTTVDGSPRLIPGDTRGYHEQMQLLMAVVGTSKGFLCIWTPQGHCVINVAFDEHLFIDQIIPACYNFFTTHLVPAIVQQNKTPDS